MRGCLSARRVPASVFFFMSPRLLGQMGMHAAFKWQDVLERFFFLGPNDKITPDVYFLL